MQYKTFTASGEIRGERTLLKGWAIKATSNAVVNIRDGGVSGDIVIPLVLFAASNSDVTPIEVPFNTDIYVEVVSGAVVGTIFFE